MLRKFYRTAIFDNIGSGSEEQNQKFVLLFSYLALSFDNIGCGSEEQNQKFVLLFSHLALSFDNIGCGSEEQNQINLFCSSLTLHYLCP